jgi:hypothetical protein
VYIKIKNVREDPPLHGQFFKGKECENTLAAFDNYFLLNMEKHRPNYSIPVPRTVGSPKDTSDCLCPYAIDFSAVKSQPEVTFSCS